jgi:shikimate dehydrogenase
MLKMGVLGKPISHSLSPVLHRRAYEILGIAAEFSAYEIDETNYFEFYKNAQDSGWRGLALTMPLKEIALGFADRIDPLAKQIRSINTIIFESTGSIGLSTDMLAFKNLLKPYFGKKIAILGAGGTARAAIGALNGTGSQVTVLTRSTIRHDQLHNAAHSLELDFMSWSGFEEIQDRDLIISTTPAGATDGLNLLTTSADFFEVTYHPWPTELAKRYQNLGRQVIGGLTLLVEQALYQIQYFAAAQLPNNKLTSEQFDQLRVELTEAGRTAINK